jgi:hypothetical protein
LFCYAEFVADELYVVVESWRHYRLRLFLVTRIRRRFKNNFYRGWVNSVILPELCGDVVGGDASSVLNVSSALEVSIRSIPSSFRSIPSAVFCLLQQNTGHCSTEDVIVETLPKCVLIARAAAGVYRKTVQLQHFFVRPSDQKISPNRDDKYFVIWIPMWLPKSGDGA